MLRIEITVPHDCVDAADYVARALAAIGYGPRVGALPSASLGAVHIDHTSLSNAGPVVNQPDSPAPETRRGRPSKKEREAAEAAAKAAAEAAEAAGTANGVTADSPEVIEPEIVDPPAAAAQDAVDELFENGPATETKTIDDLRNVMSTYMTAFGLPVTKEDSLKIFEKALGAPPVGEQGWKLSLITSSEQIGKAWTYWDTAVRENPFKRTKV